MVAYPATQPAAHQLGFSVNEPFQLEDSLQAAEHLGLKAKRSANAIERLALTPPPALALMLTDDGGLRRSFWRNAIASIPRPSGRLRLDAESGDCRQLAIRNTFLQRDLQGAPPQAGRLCFGLKPPRKSIYFGCGDIWVGFYCA